MLGSYLKLTIFLEIKCLDMYVIFMEESSYDSFAADLLVSFQEVLPVLCDIFAPSVHGD